MGRRRPGICVKMVAGSYGMDLAAGSSLDLAAPGSSRLVPRSSRRLCAPGAHPNGKPRQPLLSTDLRHLSSRPATSARRTAPLHTRRTKKSGRPREGRNLGSAIYSARGGRNERKHTLRRSNGVPTPDRPSRIRKISISRGVWIESRIHTICKDEMKTKVKSETPFRTQLKKISTNL